MAKLGFFQFNVPQAVNSDIQGIAKHLQASIMGSQKEF